MSRSIFVLTAFILVSLGDTSVRASSSKGMLHLYGIVRDADSQERIAYTMELCTKAQTTPSEDCSSWQSHYRGFYFVAVQPEHEYRLTISADGYHSREFSGLHDGPTRFERRDAALSATETWYPLGKSEIVPHSVRATAPGLFYDGNGQSNPDVAIASNNYITLAWQQNHNDNAEIFLRRWNGIQWEALGGSASMGGISNAGQLGSATEVQVVVDSVGNPVVAWKHDEDVTSHKNGDTRIRVARWQANDWVELSPLPLNASGKPSLVMLEDDRFAIAYRPNGSSTIAVYLWNFDHWIGLGESIPNLPPPTPQIPDWYRNNARWWENATLSDNTFLRGLEYGIEQGIITLPTTIASPVYRQILDWLDELSAPTQTQNGAANDSPSPQVPAWYLTHVKRWAAGEFSDEEFLASVKHLIDLGLVVLPPYSTSPQRHIHEWLREIVVQKALWWSELQVPNHEFLDLLAMLARLEVLDDALPQEDDKSKFIDGDPSLASDGKNLYLAWRNPASPDSSKILHTKWDAALEQWTETSIAIDNLAPKAEQPSLGVDGAGNPVIAWIEDGKVDVRAFDGLDWTGLNSPNGKPLFGGPPSFESVKEIQLVLDRNGLPSIAARGRSAESAALNKDDIYLTKWNGTEWIPLGGSNRGQGVSQTPISSDGFVHAYGPDGIPLVVWSLNVEMFAKRWNGEQWTHFGSTAWQEGGISNSRRDVRHPHIDASTGSRVTAVWIDTSNRGDLDVHLRTWSAVGWQDVGGSTAVGGLSPETQAASTPQVQVQRDNQSLLAPSRLVVGYLSESESHRRSLRIQSLNGKSWTPYTDGKNEVNLSDEVDVRSYQFALLPGGAPIVSFSDHQLSSIAIDPTAPFQSFIYTKYWNASQAIWESLPAFDPGVVDTVVTSTGTEFRHGPVLSMALDRHTSNPVVATSPSITPGPLMVHRWSGEQWKHLKGPGDTGSVATAPATTSKIVVDNGNIYVAWVQQGISGTNIHAAVWNNTSAAWSQLGTAEGGVSDTPENSSAVSLAMDRGFPVVAWEEQSVIGSEIYLRRWDGNTWQELDGSATAGGVSNSAQESTHPAVAVRFDNSICVSWTEGASFHEVVLRCHRPVQIHP